MAFKCNWKRNDNSNWQDSVALKENTVVITEKVLVMWTKKLKNQRALEKCK